MTLQMWDSAVVAAVHVPLSAALSCLHSMCVLILHIDSISDLYVNPLKYPFHLS